MKLDEASFYQQQEMAAHKKCDELQAQLAERDKLLEQYRADRLESDAIIYWTRHWIGQIGGGVYSLEEGLCHVNEQLSHYPDLSALEAALKAERLAGKIKGLEEAARKVDGITIARYTLASELRSMANELKEQNDYPRKQAEAGRALRRDHHRQGRGAELSPDTTARRGRKAYLGQSQGVGLRSGWRTAHTPRAGVALCQPQGSVRGSVVLVR